MKIEVIKPDSACWGDLLILHRQNAKTLGMFSNIKTALVLIMPVFRLITIMSVLLLALR